MKLHVVAGAIALLTLGSGKFGNILPVSESQGAAVATALLSTSNFAVLGGTTVTSTGLSVINGDLGLSPGTSVTGFPPGILHGTEHATDASAGTAQADLVTAYDSAASQGSTATISTDLGGQTLTPGVYNSASSIGLSGTLTLNGEGDPNAVFIFQAGSTLTTGSGSSVNLINDAQACNVFWQVGSSATLGTNSTFVGNIFALTDITVTTGANVSGRVLARNGAVTLDTNNISVPTTCTHAATLRVIKLVIDDDPSSTVVPTDFNIYVKNASSGLNVSGSPARGTSTPGTLYSLPVGSTYVISEDPNSGYTQSFSGACAPSGSVTLSAGNQVCTIINTNIPAPAAVPVANKSSGSNTPNSGGSLVPLIGILKIPTPLSLPNGSGSVTYNYTVWNVAGRQALKDVTVKDDKCSPVTLLSGDVNSNSKIDPGENWKYSCSATLSTTTTNTAIATGYSDDANHQAAIATSIATVVVGESIQPPLINIIKVPSPTLQR